MKRPAADASLQTTFHGNLKYMRLAWFAISPEGRTSDTCPTHTPAWSFLAKNLGTASKEKSATAVVDTPPLERTAKVVGDPHSPPRPKAVAGQGSALEPARDTGMDSMRSGARLPAASSSTWCSRSAL